MGIIGNMQNNIAIYEIKSFYVALAVGFFSNNIQRKLPFTHS
jgi:hypothetical protein